MVGKTHHALKQTDDAIEAFLKARKLVQDDANVLFTLGELYVIKGNKNEATKFQELLVPVDKARAAELKGHIEKMSAK